MPAGIKENDTMFSVREVPWHKLGTVLDKNPRSVAEVIKKAKLGWEVIKTPMFIKVGRSYIEVPDYYVTVRKDTKEPLAPVHERYEVVQNVDAFNFLDGILGEIIAETAGSLWNGRKVWLMTKLPDHIEVAGDAVNQFALVSTSHDGKQACMLAVTPVRVVCQNTLTWALGSAQRTYTVRHLGNPSAKLHEAREALGITVNYYKQFKKVGDKLATKKLTERKFDAILRDLYGTTEGMGDRAIRNREQARETIKAIFAGTTAIAQATSPATVGNAPGTAWAAANAIAEFQDHYSRAKGEGVFVRALDDPGSIKVNGFKAIAESVGVSLN